jgi:hypothetical protein
VPLPQKRWFRLADLAKRWSLQTSDIEDYALDEQLQLAVFVVDLPAEMACLGGSSGRRGSAAAGSADPEWAAAIAAQQPAAHIP